MEVHGWCKTRPHFFSKSLLDTVSVTSSQCYVQIHQVSITTKPVQSH